MTSKDLRQFLQLASEAGPDFHVTARKPLSPRYEIAALQHDLARKGRFPVLMCPRVEGHEMALVTGLFGSYALLGLALDVRPETLEREGPGAVFRAYVERRQRPVAPSAVPVSNAPVREVIWRGDEIDLGRLPIATHCEHDSGRYITAGMTITRDPETGIPNVGFYRQEVQGRNRLACSLIPGHHGALIAERHAARGEVMEAATVIGHHPALGLAAVSMGALEMNELELAGGFLGAPLEVIRGLTVNLPVPALAEIVIEGTIDPQERTTDGPFPEFLGYYGAAGPCHVMQVRAVTTRADAIYHDLQPSHQEHNLVAMIGHEADVFERVRDVVPSVKAVHFGPDGCCGKSFAFISIEKRSEDEGRRAGLAALESRRYFKVVVVVDGDVDVYDEREVWWAVGTRVRWDRDTVTMPALPSSSMNPLADYGPDGSPRDARILIDATRSVMRSFPQRAAPPEAVRRAVRLADYLE